ncbi:MAG: hypothetical protein WBK10_04790 [Bacillota bacterium]
MISAVSNWVKAVAAVGVLVAFVDMMAPKGALRRSVDMTIALVVVAAIVGPVVEIGAALLPAAERAFASQGGQARAAAATSGIADGLELCLSYGLQAAYPDVADGWHVRVTLGESGFGTLSGARVDIDTFGWTQDEATRSQVAAVAAACVGVKVEQVSVR